jgi:hypothetical protein
VESAASASVKVEVLATGGEGAAAGVESADSPSVKEQTSKIKVQLLGKNNH